MPDTPEPPGSPAEDADLGAPIAELRDLSLTVDERFGRRVRGGIERRVLAGEFVDLAWTAAINMALELLRAPFEWFGNRRQP